MSQKVNDVKRGLLEKIGDKIALTNSGAPVMIASGKAVEPGDSLQPSVTNIGTDQLIVFREDKALEILDDESVNLSGILDTPARWIEARTSIIAGLAAFIMIDRENLQIDLITEERYKFKNTITGILEFHPAFILFGINSDRFIKAQKLGELIKMNRTFFDDKNDALRLVALLKNFEAKVDKDIAQANDGRGNVKELRQQVVTSNLPEAFYMKLPIFKGYKAIKLEVEVEIEPGDLTCRLVSPQANEETERLRDEAIDDIIDRIKAVDPTIVILEK